MEFHTFERIITCFADSTENIIIDKGTLVMEIGDEEINAQLHQTPDGVFVEEDGEKKRAEKWIIKRLARLDSLADRICDYVRPTEHFVVPHGQLLDAPDENPTSSETPIDNVVDTLMKRFDTSLAGTTSVMYLTSDAGEGKTSLIYELALQQAKRYKNKKSESLFVPIELGGRTFLRFDDVVISTLVNRFRFQRLYYGAFMELVKLGVLVPAFDGFEEMIVEGGSGEAISALGDFIKRLGSCGTLLVAARKAYFDYPTFDSQARLFDTVGHGVNVNFSRLSLNRWDKTIFEEYARKRGVISPTTLFKKCAERLKQREDHPVLTRAVLVKRLIDIAIKAEAERLLERLGTSEKDYFYEFVCGIVDREATEKWTDRSGVDGKKGLLSVEEHHALLASIAQEMWIGNTAEIKADVLSIVIEIFCDQYEKSQVVERQIVERIKQHSLLSTTPSKIQMIEFDHEDFREFYLGQALGNALAQSDIDTVHLIIENRALPVPAIAEASRFIRRCKSQIQDQVMNLIQDLAKRASMTSFVRENCGIIMLELINGECQSREIYSMSFPIDALLGKRLEKVKIVKSYFQPTQILNTQLRNCQFVDCRFERIRIDTNVNIVETSFDEDCWVKSVVLSHKSEIQRFEPEQIRCELRKIGFQIISDKSNKIQQQDEGHDLDENLVLVQRFLRTFLRSTRLNEDTIKTRLGKDFNHFVKLLLPRLLDAEIVERVPCQGRKHRLRLVGQMQKVEKSIRNSRGKFDKFISNYKQA